MNHEFIPLPQNSNWCARYGCTADKEQHSMDITREQDEAMTREIDAHDEALKEAIERGICLMCARGPLETHLLPRSIQFQCRDYICGWFAIYPIRTLGNSERAQRDEELDLIALAEKEVIANGRIALKAWRAMGSANGTAFTIAKTAFDEAQCEWLASVVLLESRIADRSKLAELQAAMKSTESLQPWRL